MIEKKCSKCNFVLSPSEQFCSECGTNQNQSTGLVANENLNHTKTNYQYKAVTFQSFMIEVLGERRKQFSSEIDTKGLFTPTNTNPELDYLNKKVIPLVNEMFNYYGKQGWEYFDSIEVPINHIQNLASHSVMKELFKSWTKQEEKMPRVLTHYIFRKS